MTKTRESGGLSDGESARESRWMIVTHLAVWPGLYVASAVLCVAQIAGLLPRVRSSDLAIAMAAACVTAVMVYLLDRVKLRDAWLDPSDALARPRQYAFLSRHSTKVRLACAGLGAIATGLLLDLSPRYRALDVLVPLLALACGVLYAGWPRSQTLRPKDVRYVKNAAVAAGITGFASLLAFAALARSVGDAAAMDSIIHAPLPIVCAAAFLLLRSGADAIICDLDDECADRRYRTDSLAVKLGKPGAWRIAAGIRVAAAIALLCIPGAAFWPRAAWATMTMLSSLLLRVVSPPMLRDWVDVRFTLEAIAATGLIAFAQGLH